MNNPKAVSLDAQPLALHIRRHRQWHGEAGLSQEDLARLAGVSTRSLHRYENGRELPRPVEILLAVSLTLDVPLTSLIDPRLVAKMQSRIDARRRRRTSESRTV